MTAMAQPLSNSDLPLPEKYYQKRKSWKAWREMPFEEKVRQVVKLQKCAVPNLCGKRKNHCSLDWFALRWQGENSWRPIKIFNYDKSQKNVMKRRFFCETDLTRRFRRCKVMQLTEHSCWFLILDTALYINLNNLVISILSGVIVLLGVIAFRALPEPS